MASFAADSWPGYSEDDVLAIDCEMVAVALTARSPLAEDMNSPGIVNALCRVSIVSCSEDAGFETRLDAWVDIGRDVVDFRSAITGLDAATFASKPKTSFWDVRDQVRALIAGRIVVGHAVWNDFEILKLSHPSQLVRDSALFAQLRPPWRTDRLPSLRMLASHWLKADMHYGQHDSVEDATVALKLYKLHQIDWERYYGNRVLANCCAGGSTDCGGVQVVPQTQQQVHVRRWPLGVVPPLASVQHPYCGAWCRGLQDWQRHSLSLPHDSLRDVEAQIQLNCYDWMSQAAKQQLLNPYNYFSANATAVTA